MTATGLARGRASPPAPPDPACEPGRPAQGSRRRVRSGTDWLLVGSDAIAATAAAVVAAPGLVRGLCYVTIVVAAAAAAGLYRPRIGGRVSDQAGRLACAAALPAFALLPWTSQHIVVRLAGVAVGLVIGMRVATVAGRCSVRRRGMMTQQTLIIGAGEHARQVHRLLRQHPELGLRPCGALDDGATGEARAAGRSPTGGLARSDGLAPSDGQAVAGGLPPADGLSATRELAAAHGLAADGPAPVDGLAVAGDLAASRELAPADGLAATRELAAANGQAADGPAAADGLAVAGDLVADGLAAADGLAQAPALPTAVGLQVDGSRDTLRALPVLGRIATAATALDRFDVAQVLVCAPQAAGPDVAVALRACRERSIRVSVLPPLPEYGLAVPRACLDEIWGIPFVPLRPGVDTLGRRIVTRALDLIVGTALLLAVLPLVLIMALAVRLDLGLPPLFWQVRVVGRDRLARISKLRTLRPAGDPDRTWEVAAEQSSRLTRVLRRTHADELPQLASVVRGDMSLVGPRPERPYFASQLRRSIRDYAQRERVRGGLTGWAQVHGLTGDTPIEDRARFDNFYIEYWSIWLDLLILARTGLAALSGALTKGGTR